MEIKKLRNRGVITWGTSRSPQPPEQQWIIEVYSYVNRVNHTAEQEWVQFICDKFSFGTFEEAFAASRLFDELRLSGSRWRIRNFETGEEFPGELII